MSCESATALGSAIASQTTRPQVYKSTSGCHRTRCLVDSLSCSLGEALKSRRLVSTSVRHHSSIPLKYSPLGGNTGGYGGEEGLTMSNFGFMLSYRFADHETTRLQVATAQLCRLRDHKTTRLQVATAPLVVSLTCCLVVRRSPIWQPPDHCLEKPRSLDTKSPIVSSSKPHTFHL